MKKFGLGSILKMVVMIAAGVFLLLRPGDTLDIVIKAIGGIILLIGAVGVISWFLQKSSLEKPTSGCAPSQGCVA